MIMTRRYPSSFMLVNSGNQLNLCSLSVVGIVPINLLVWIEGYLYVVSKNLASMSDNDGLFELKNNDTLVLVH